MEYLLAISILWTLILLVQAFVFNKTGRLLLPYLQQRGMYSNNTRNGMFRIEMAIGSTYYDYLLF